MKPWSGILLFLMAAGGAVAADLRVEVRGIQGTEGNIRLALYDDPKTFRKEEHSRLQQSQPAQAGTLTFRIEGLAPGRYALIVYHDADSSGTLNRFLGMIPTEGYGLSNNPQVSGPPAFNDAAFEVTDSGLDTVIELRY